VWSLLRHVGDWDGPTIVVGVGALLALFVLERWVPKVPASLLVLAVGIAVSAAADLDDHGVDVVGRIPRAIPTPAWPAISASDWIALSAGAFGLALVVFAESYSIAGRFAREHGDEVDADREMTAMGAANVIVGLFKDSRCPAARRGRPPPRRPAVPPRWSRRSRRPSSWSPARF